MPILRILKPYVEEIVIYADETWPRVEKMVKRALREGHAIRWPDGSEETQDESPYWGDDWHVIERYDNAKGAYFVKWWRRRVIEHPDGTKTETELSPSWRKV